METTLIQLTDKIQEALNRKETVICAFLDTKRAFDNTPHEVVKKAFDNRGVDGTTSELIARLLSTRIAEAEIGQDTIALCTTRECSQGGVASPLIWSIIIDQLLCDLTDLGISCQGYVDNMVMLAKGKFENTLCDIVQRELEFLWGWCQMMGLNIKPTKTTSVAFTRKRNLNLKTIKMDGTIIEWKSD